MNFAAKFGVCRPQGSGNIAIFKSHVIPRDYNDKKILGPNQPNLLIIMKYPAKRPKDQNVIEKYSF